VAAARRRLKQDAPGRFAAEMKRSSVPPLRYSLKIAGEKGKEVIFSFAGRIALQDLSSWNTEIRARLREMYPAKLIVDLSQVDYLDSAGALELLNLKQEALSRSVVFEFAHLPETAQGIMELLDREDLAATPLIAGRDEGRLVEELGEGARRFAADLAQVTAFLGELLRALAYALLHPRTVRWEDVASYMKRAGLDGLPIVSLISFLLGLILAFMSSLQLKQFGANVYVAPLLAIAVVKELGPIMTAILVAGRSGSAFAAEIGTMKVNEEVDALTTMGFDPISFLAVPKVLAAMVVVPLLTIYADLFAIAGGLVVGVMGLDLTAYTYLKDTQASLTLMDIIPSLIKSGVFALLIAGIGCQRGFQVRGGAEAVGTATTSAVVAALFLIIVTDSAFALAFHYLGI
jgi:phospholipid/cholesterol/gamma-HCH transport system permease protein